MELNDKVTQLEDEIKILKNEIQAVLLDLRESYLSNKNPFNISEPPAVTPPVLVAQPPLMQTVPADVEPAKEISVIKTNVETSNIPVSNEKDSILEPKHLDAEKKPFASMLDEINLLKEPEPENRAERGFQNEQEINGGNNPSAVMKEWRVKTGISGIRNASAGTDCKPENIEIGVITKLAQWVETSVKQLGTRRTETMLDIADMMGYIGRDLKDILTKLIAPAAGKEINTVNARDYLAAWLELASILGKDNKPEIALFYMLCQEAENR